MINLAPEEIHPDKESQHRCGNPQSADRLERCGGRKLIGVRGDRQTRHDGQQDNIENDRTYNCESKDAARIIAIGRFIQKWKERQKPNANPGDSNSRYPLDLANDRDLSIKRQEFEEEQE